MTGLLGEVAKGIVHTSLGGFIVTQARYEFVSFSPGIFKTANRAFIRRPQDTDFSFVYYIGQFLATTWISLSAFYFICWFSLLLILSNYYRGSKIIQKSAEIQLRAIVSMVI